MVKFGSKVVYPTDPEDIRGNVNTVGNAELAVRLGSIATFDRRGNILWMDDFEGVFLNWGYSAVGIGAAVSLSTSQALTGSQSCKLTTSTIPDIPIIIYKRLAYPILGRMGFEIAFTYSADIVHWRVSHVLYDGTSIHKPGIIYDKGLNAIYYYDNEGDTVKIADVPTIPSYDYLFNKVKLVVDFAKGKYVKLIFNDIEYPLTDIAYQKVTDDTLAHMYPNFSVWDPSVNNTNVYVDNVIFTQNEP